jgi:two-component system response regulator YesN
MYKLLVLDDEEVIRRGLKAIIQKGVSDFEIYDAADGKEGLEIIAKKQPDIVITDIRMPHLDGLELIAQVYKSSVKRPVFIIISGYDDFNYAKQAIKFGVKEYLLKPIVKEELIQLLNSIIRELDDNVQRHKAELVKSVQSKMGVELLKEKYLNLLIEGNFNDDRIILTQLAQLGVNFRSDSFRVLVAEFHADREALLKTFDVMERFALKKAVDDGITGMIKDFWSFYDFNLRMIFLFSNPESFLIEAQIRKICDQIKRDLSSRLKVDTFFGVGYSVTGIINICKSYTEALNLAMYKIVSAPGDIMFNKDAVAAKNDDHLFQINLVKLSSDIELNMKNNISSLLDEYLQQFTLYKRAVSRLAQFYNELNKYIFSYFTERGVDFSKIFGPGEVDFRELDSFWTMEELKNYLKNYLYKICDMIVAYKNASPDRKIIEKVIRFIWDNYDKDINLNVVADHFSKSNSYLSVLFKKETGRNFVDYLTMIKIEKAKELLADNKLKIQDIAIKVGYPNAKHFCMVFKKSVGISPTQYREDSL